MIVTIISGASRGIGKAIKEDLKSLDTAISEPVNFVRKFITDEIDSKKYNGFFLHVRDDLSTFDGNKFKLRRIE